MDFETSISAIVLVVVFFLIAIRQVGSLKLQIWQIMLFGALSVALLGQISPEEAIRSVNLDVMIFLAGMFIIGEAMQESGYLLHLSNSIFQRAKNLDQLLLLILFGIGFLSALLMNDTLAIIGTPIVLYFARVQNISPKLLLLTLAVAVTTGSALSPIGNPQNLLIAVDGELANPFLVFIQYLFLPTVVNLLLAYLLLRFLFKDQFLKRPLEIHRSR
jgi:Na+/H+ antiporter NhaD/arsenite permease-like protein